MKVLKQLVIILFLSVAGELLHNLIPLPIPSSIYGLVAFLALLITKTIKLDRVEEISTFLISIMPIFFIVPLISVVHDFHTFKNELIPILIIISGTTVLNISVTAKLSDYLISKEKQK